MVNHIFTIITIDKQQGPTVEHRELHPLSCDKPYWKRTYVCVTESLGYTAKRNNIVNQLDFNNIKNKKIKNSHTNTTEKKDVSIISDSERVTNYTFITKVPPGLQNSWALSPSPTTHTHKNHSPGILLLST